MLWDEASENLCVDMAGLFLLGHLKLFPFWGNLWGGTGAPVQYWFRFRQIGSWGHCREHHASCL